MPFTPTMSDIRQVLEEVHKHYILVERDSTEDAPQHLVVDMARYVSALQSMIYDLYELEIPFERLMGIFKQCVGAASKKESNYIKLTHHSFKDDT